MGIATEFFNNTLPIMEEKPCWKMMDNASIPCSQYESSDILSAMREVKSWMRTPDCASVRQDADLSEGCCGPGYINAKGVDVYYWPEPDSNTACLSIVGNSVHPLDYGATTNMDLTYWGCTAMNPKTSITISDINGPSGNVVSSTTMTIVQSIITTAQITLIGSITFKQSLVNPWTPAACIQETSVPSSPSVPAETHSAQGAIHARAHSLLFPSSVNQVDGLPASTVVSGGFTFTSPWIYANFHSITANDWCGQLGSEAIVTQTMLTFSPGELSTIAGPVTNSLDPLFPGKAFSTRRFNFADLPCPPQSVMEENWYKPRPGEPYRPLIALPSQITSIDPSYTYCIPLFFTAFDPPQTLVPASAMASKPTAGQIMPTSIAPKPNASLKFGATKTAVQHASISTSDTVSSAPKPGNTKILAPDPQMQGSDSQSQFRSGQQGDDPRISGSSINQESSSIQDEASVPVETKQTNQVLSGLDPEHASPDPTSHIESALGTSPQSQPAIASDGNLSDLQSSIPLRSQQAPGGQPPVKSAARPQPSSAQSFPLSSAPSLPEVYVSVVDKSIVVDASGTSSEASEAAVDENLSTVPRITPPGQKNLVESGGRIVHLPSAGKVPATSIYSHAVEAISEGVSIDGNTVTAGAAPMTTSGMAISVDSSHNIYLAGAPYQIPTSSPAPVTTLADEAIAVPLHDGISIHGTTLKVGAPAINILWTPVSLDASSNLVIGGGVTNVDPSLAPTASETSNSDDSMPMTNTQQTTTAATAAIEVHPTLSPGAAAVTENRMSVSTASSGGLMIGSETMVLRSSEGGLGSLIVGGLQTGGPAARTALPTSQGSPTSDSQSSTSSEHTSGSEAECAKSCLPWETLAFVGVITMWLHI